MSSPRRSLPAALVALALVVAACGGGDGSSGSGSSGSGSGGGGKKAAKDVTLAMITATTTQNAFQEMAFGAKARHRLMSYLHPRSEILPTS